MDKYIVVCIGKNATSRSESARAMKTNQSVIVIEATDITSLHSYLKPYGGKQLKVMLNYFFTPDKTILHNQQEWWRERVVKFEKASPIISNNLSSAKANINLDTGGGFITFIWETILAIDLESFCQVLFDILEPTSETKNIMDPQISKTPVKGEPIENKPKNKQNARKKWWQFWK